MIGYGTTCDAYHRVAIMPDGRQSTRALQLAMKDARINEDGVDYINFHGTSTMMNDRIETLAVKGALNGYAMKVPVSSTKSMVGHPQGASGALGVAVTALSLRDGLLTPTINLENPDPDCDMDYIANESRDQSIQIAISNIQRLRANPIHFNEDPTRGSRPFNRDREGFVLAEGSWMLVMEELEHAQKRKAPIYAELIGYGTTCDAYHRVAIMPDGRQSTRALQLAMKDARINEDGVDYINFHGTSTMMNDRIETLAVKGALNGYAMKVPVSSTKSMVGHPQGASGALGVAVTALSLRDGVLTPTINLENPDPDCDMDYIANESRDQSVQVAISNCISFGSKNSALVLKKFQ